MPRYRVIAKTPQVTRQINTFNGTGKSSAVSKIHVVVFGMHFCYKTDAVSVRVVQL